MENPNLRSFSIETVLVDREPMKIEIFEKWSLGVIRCGKVDSHLRLSRNPIDRQGTIKNYISESIDLLR
jgi:hypothetical protein